VSFVAFTTTIPQEYIWAAGLIPLDLNNYFITGDSNLYSMRAEELGMPRNTCSWIKGLLGVFTEQTLLEEISLIIAVTEGDCSNNHGLMSLYKYYFPSIPVLGFSYPSDKNEAKLSIELNKLGSYLGVKTEDALKYKKILDKIRAKIAKLDEQQDLQASIPAEKIQKLLVSATDFNGDYLNYEKQLDEMLGEINHLESQNYLKNKLADGEAESGEDYLQLKEQAEAKSIINRQTVKLGYCGVPCIIKDLFTYIEDNFSAKISYFEVERDFCMLTNNETLEGQYLSFLYPYDVYARIDNINAEVLKRKLDAMIYYTQSFCHRQIDTVLMKNLIKVPLLVVEGDAPSNLDMRTKIRIESFMENLIAKKGRGKN